MIDYDSRLKISLPEVEPPVKLSDDCRVVPWEDGMVLRDDVVWQSNSGLDFAIVDDGENNKLILLKAKPFKLNIEELQDDVTQE